ncbi:hypothetical protein FOMPIDRAFT_37516, partial [Fomitopsis schrenkii]
MPERADPEVTVAPPPPSQPARRPPDLPLTQQKASKAARLAREEDIERVIEGWYNYSVNVAAKLSEDHGKSHQHFLTRMFHAGANIMNSRRPNAYNTWIHHVANTVNEGEYLPKGERKKLSEIHAEHGDEYNTLTAEEKERLIEELMQDRESNLNTEHVTSHGRKRTLNAGLSKIERLFEFLKLTCDIEATYLVVRSDGTFEYPPTWFFTNPAMGPYMENNIRRGFNLDQVGAIIEGFTLSKCDLTAITKSGKAKAKLLKSQIRTKINDSLAEITKSKKVQMSYKNFERDIVVEYGINIVGWSHPTWKDPSKLSTSLPALQTLLDALNSGACHFVRLSKPEHAKRKAAHEAKVKSGEIVPRKIRSDAGRKRQKRKKTSRDAESSDEENRPARKRRR